MRDRRRVPPHLFNFAGSPNDLSFGVNYTPLETPFYKVCLRHIRQLNKQQPLRQSTIDTSPCTGEARMGLCHRGGKILHIHNDRVAMGMGIYICIIYIFII